MSPSPLVLRAGGLVAGGLLLILPARTGIEDPLTLCGLRIVCFFYTCKLWDITIARADNLPVRLIQTPDGTTQPAPMETTTDKVTYLYLLTTEMRYHSFDTAAHQNRPPLSARAGLLWAVLPFLILTPLAYVSPAPEAKIPLILLVIQQALEGAHTLLHRSCPDPLFYKPFAAPSLTAFWSTHWHSCAAPFFRSLAYEPGKKVGGRWFGVLLTFALSGAWHGWASAALAEEGYEWVLGLQVCGVFVWMGVGCLIERALFYEKRGWWISTLQWLFAWVSVAWAAGRCWETVECHGRIGWLRSNHCT
ncbi:hypothetical protein K431DRAFT_347962 [Polychaeton citri CBS 116435]|uniref:Wax synthase domain-containing protein n=1 Tax=Polychaeton citri CBS 116435 TaxID=1314669 RepID=A0A9P4Q4P4_9PEZI|nr:hypothetical protein K431DRAFT_347962 [Polychaeton citri CBS 116435]